MHFTRRLIALAFATSLLSACFVNNLIYRHIDWIILFQLDKYFDLESSQEKFVEIAVKDTVSWFKRDRMADVIELLGIELAAAKARRLDADSTDKWFKILDENRRLIIARTLPTMVQVGMTLSIDQIDHFAKLIDRGNRNLKLAAEAELKDFPSIRFVRTRERIGSRLLKNTIQPFLRPRSREPIILTAPFLPKVIYFIVGERRTGRRCAQI